MQNVTLSSTLNMADFSKVPGNLLDLPLEVRAEMAMRAAFQKLVKESALLGRPLYLWRDSKVVAVPAQELLNELNKQ